MRSIEGWLQADEADLLLQVTALSLADGPTPNLVEVGSYMGRSTSVLANVVKALRPAARVYAIDPHEGELSVAGFAGPQRSQPTSSAFQATLADAGLDDVVVTIERRSWEVPWDRPIALLFIDGLHDRESVKCDFLQFEPWLFEGAYVIFHDYGDLWPEVKEVVDELIAAGRLQRVAEAGSLIVLRSRETCDQQGGAPLPESRVDPPDLRDLLHIAQLGALSAGQLLLERSQPGSVRHKRARADLVTDADLEAERRIRATIERHRPQDSILAEESGEKRGDSGVRWIVDSLDGTVNYVAGASVWAVAVAAENCGGGGG
ncbi:MAG: inositol monophosphatase family protein [Solirubrobacterales bacterium]